MVIPVNVQAKKTRVIEIDILRVLATILVVIGHSAYYQIISEYGAINYDQLMFENAVSDVPFHLVLVDVVRAIYLFHMPVFFMISGAAFRGSMGGRRPSGNWIEFKNLLVNKTKRCLIPFATVSLLYSVPLKLLGGYFKGRTATQVFGDIFKGQLLLLGNNYLWYLWALFLITLLVWLVERFLPIHDFFKIILFVIISQLRHSLGWPQTYQAMENCIFFYLGYLWFSYAKEWKAWFLQRRFIGGVAAIVLGLSCYICLHGTDPLLFEPSRSIAIVSSTILLYWFALILMEHCNIRKFEVWRILENSTFALYLYTDPLNYLILYATTSLFGITFLGTDYGAFILFSLRTLGVSLAAIGIATFLKRRNIPYLS